jgi:WD40 repeat protein
VLLGHEEAVLSLSVGRAGLRSAGADGVRTWPLPWGPDPDVLTYHRTRAEGNPYPYVYAVKFSPDGSMLASGGWDRTARLVEMDTLDLRTTIETGSDYVFDLAYAPDGRRLVGGDAKLFLWEPATGRKVAEWIAQGRNPLCSFAFGRDNRHVVAGDSLGRVLVFRGDGLELVTTWEGHEGKVQDLALSPDGARLASVAADGVCLIRSFPGGEVRHRLRSDAGGTWGVAFDGGGRRVATVGTDGIVRVWDTDNGAELLQLAGHTDRIYAVAFHPDGRLLASGSNDNTIRLWDLERGSEVASLLGHRSYVYGLDFSPDGTTLASASGDNTVRLWSTRTMAERHARALEARARKAGR